MPEKTVWEEIKESEDSTAGKAFDVGLDTAKESAEFVEKTSEGDTALAASASKYLSILSYVKDAVDVAGAYAQDGIAGASKEGAVWASKTALTMAVIGDQARKLALKNLAIDAVAVVADVAGIAIAPEIIVVAAIGFTVYTAGKAALQIAGLIDDARTRIDGSVTDPITGIVTTHAHDRFGEPVTITFDPSTGKTHYVFGMGQSAVFNQDGTSSVVDTDGRSYQYDAVGHCISGNLDGDTRVVLGSDGAFYITDGGDNQISSGVVSSVAGGYSAQIGSGPVFQLNQDGTVTTTDSTGQTIVLQADDANGVVTMSTTTTTTELINNADGTPSIKYTNSDGSTDTQTFDNSGNLTKDLWTEASGKHGVYTSNPTDGSNETKLYSATNLLVADGWQNADGSGGYTVLNEATNVTETFSFDSAGRTTSIRMDNVFGAPGWNVSSEQDFTYYEDGALRSVTSMTDAGHHFDSGNRTEDVLQYSETGQLKAWYRATLDFGPFPDIDFSLDAFQDVVSVNNGLHLDPGETSPERDALYAAMPTASIWRRVPGVVDHNGNYSAFAALANDKNVFDVQIGVSYEYGGYAFAGGVDAVTPDFFDHGYVAGTKFNTVYDDGVLRIPVYELLPHVLGHPFEDVVVRHIVGYKWKNPDGTTTEDDQYADGTHFYEVLNPDQSGYSTTTLADGSEEDDTYGVGHHKVGDTWHKPDGSYGNDTFNPDGSSNGVGYRANGSYSTFVSTPAASTRYTSYDYSAGGELTGESVQQADGTTSAYTYSDGRVTGIDVHNADGSHSVSTYVYNAAGAYALTVVTTPAAGPSTTVVYTYDVAGHLVTESVQNPDGSTVSYAFDAAGRVTDVLATNADGSTVADTHTYNADGTEALTRVATAAGATVSTTTVYNYDTAGLLATESVQNPDGSSVDYVFDSSGRVASALSTNADGSTASDTYDYNADSSYSLTRVSTAAGATDSTTVVYGYDTAGLLATESVQNPDGSTAAYSFDSIGRTTSALIENADGSSVADSYTYAGSGAYTLTRASTAAGDSDPTTVSYGYDPLGHLRSESVTNPDGSSADYFLDGSGRTVESAYYAGDGSSTVDRYEYQVDGSYSLTRKSTTVDADVTTVQYGYDPAGHLVSQAIQNPDGSSSAYGFNASGQTTSIDVRNTDGSTVADRYAFNADGSYSLTVITTPAGSTAATTVAYNYDAGGHLVGEDVGNPDGSSAAYTFDSSGRVASITSHNADGSSALDVYGYNADGSYSLTVDSMPASGGVGTIVVYDYDASGSLVSTTTGSETSTTTTDAEGNVTTVYFGPTGVPTHDAWQRVDGSSGTDTFYPNGSSSGTVTLADGTSDTFFNDGQGDVTTTYFSATGAKTNDAWQKADGSYGTDTFNADGSSSGEAHYADGSSSVSTNDGQGDWRTQYYDSADVLTRDSWHTSDGTDGTDAYAADGTTPVAQTWLYVDGSYSSFAENADGTWVAKDTGPDGSSETKLYAADGSTLVSDHSEQSDGSVTNTSYFADGSFATTWSDPIGEYGFDVFNAQTGEDRIFTFYDINHWDVSDSYEFSDGATLLETAAPEPHHSAVVRTDYLLDGRLIPVNSDKDFGLEPLRGIDVTTTPIVDGVQVTGVAIELGTLAPFSTDTAAALSGGTDPLAAVAALITANHAESSVREIVYPEGAPQLAGYLTVSGAQTYYHGVNGSFGLWSAHLYDPLGTQGGTGGGGGGGGGAHGIAQFFVFDNPDGSLSVDLGDGHFVTIDASYYGTSLGVGTGHHP